MTCRPSLFRLHLCHFDRRSLVFSCFLLIVILGTVSSSASKSTAAVTTTTDATVAAKQLKCSELKQFHTWDDILSCKGNRITSYNKTLIMELDISNALQEDFMKIFNSNNSKDVNHVSIIASQSKTLTEISFAKPLLFNFEKRSLKLLDNPILHTVDVKIETDSQEEVHVEVRGNKMLTKGSLKNLKAIEFQDATSYIQDLGECRMLSSQLGHFDDLKHCKYFDTNLVITGETKTTSLFPSTLTEVKGCLSIVGTDLQNLDFLKFLNGSCSTGHKISGNRNVCIHPEFEEFIVSNFPDNMTITNADRCEAECSSSYLLSKKNPKCVVVTDTLTITGMKKGDQTSHLEGIRTIRGRLVIDNNHMENFDFFKSLIAVIGEGSTVDEPAIEVKLNKNMKTFSLPLVEDVYTNPPQKAFYFAENGQYKMDCEMKENFEQKLLKRRVDIADCNPTVAIPRNGTSNQNQKQATSAPNSSLTAIGVSIGSISVFLVYRHLILQ